MIIECPVCPKPAPRYKIDASLIGDAGREVRCPRCGHEWFVTLEDFAQSQASQPPGAGPHVAMHTDAPQIVGATFVSAPPYDEPVESAGSDERGREPRSKAQLAPQPVSAGAALAIAAASSGEDDHDAESAGDGSGAPHVPSTAAEIASAFFASSFEERQEDEQGDASS